MVSEKFTNAVQTTLTASIIATDTSLTVADASTFPSSGNFRIIIDSEILLVTAVSSNTLTVTRGIESTVAASHASAAAVQHIGTAGNIIQAFSDNQLLDTYANLPTSEYRLGRLFKASDSVFDFVDTNGAWKTWFNGYVVTPPVLSNFTWVNQGSCTAVTTHGGIIIENPDANLNNEQVRALVQSLPSPPYTATLGFIPNTNYFSNSGNCGLILYNSSSTYIVSLAITDRATDANETGDQISSWRWSNPTTFLSSPFTYYRIWTGPYVWFRIKDDNTNRIFSYSMDGFNFNKAYSESRTTGTTPDKVGFYINNYSSSVSTGYNGGAFFFHFSVTTP